MSKAEIASEAAATAPEKRPSCFVIMPISDQPDYKPGHFKEVYEDLIRPSVSEAGYDPIRADQVHEANLIHLDILGRIVDASLAICDVSALNPNVMFELGIRQAFDKPVVLIKDSKTRNPFDISPIRYVQYDESLSYRSMLSNREILVEAIRATARAKPGENVNSIVSLLGLRAAAMKPSEENPETARMTLIEKALGDIAGEVRQIRSGVNKAGTYFVPNKSLFNGLSQKEPSGLYHKTTLTEEEFSSLENSGLLTGDGIAVLRARVVPGLYDASATGAALMNKPK